MSILGVHKFDPVFLPRKLKMGEGRGLSGGLAKKDWGPPMVKFLFCCFLIDQNYEVSVAKWACDGKGSSPEYAIA